MPATRHLASEWGPSSGDVRHRVSLSLFSSAVKNLTVMIGVSASTGTPYTIRTGYDDNGDGIFNDRPAGVGRNTVRATGMLELVRHLLVHDRAREEEGRRRNGLRGVGRCRPA